jgi:hypothetical protein
VLHKVKIINETEKLNILILRSGSTPFPTTSGTTTTVTSTSTTSSTRNSFH